MVQLLSSFELVVPLFAIATVLVAAGTAAVAWRRARPARAGGSPVRGATLTLDALLVLWLVGLLLVTLAPGRTPGRGGVELVPLRGIHALLTSAAWWQVPLVQIGGNVALFVPGGALAVARWHWGVGRTTLACLAIALAVETLQGATDRGVASVDDVLLAALGAAVGAATWSLGARVVAHRRAGRAPVTAAA